MNGLLVAAMVMGSGSGLALTNDTVRETVSENTNQVMVKVQNMFKGSKIENVKAEGFAYPSEEYLANLTEDQAFQVVSAIDVINAEYDWANMSDDEITEALALVKAELHDLYIELGIEGPLVQSQLQKRQGQSESRGKGNRGSREDFIPRGDGVPDEDCLTDDDLVEDDDAI